MERAKKVGTGSRIGRKAMTKAYIRKVGNTGTVRHADVQHPHLTWKHRNKAFFD